MCALTNVLKAVDLKARANKALHRLDMDLSRSVLVLPTLRSTCVCIGIYASCFCIFAAHFEASWMAVALVFISIVSIWSAEATRNLSQCLRLQTADTSDEMHLE